MTRLIELPQELEEIAAAQAQSKGKSVEEFLPELIANALTSQQPSAEYNPADREARIRRFRQWAESNGHTTPHLSDEAVTRAAIYREL